MIKSLLAHGGPGDISVQCQYWLGVCPFCGSDVRIPLDNKLVDWESAFNELKYEMGSVIDKQAREIERLIKESKEKE